MFQIGDKVVYPMHGAGIIDRIEEKEILGNKQSYYIMHLPIGSMDVMIPTAPENGGGLRPVVDTDRAKSVMKHLPELEVDATTNWNKRYRDNMLRLKGGELEEVAYVVKSLITREGSRALSTSERKMLVSARQILISELVLALDMEKSKAEEEVEAALFHVKEE